jgi:5-methylcytosine-specific restriction endonuclease McrA
MRQNTRRKLRTAVAERTGCEPGGLQVTACAYCDQIALVDWTDESTGPRFLTVERVGDEYVRTTAHLDHVIPESKNGPTSPDNTVIACAVCNMAKGDSAFGDMAFLEWLRGRRRRVHEAVGTFFA